MSETKALHEKRCPSGRVCLYPEHCGVSCNRHSLYDKDDDTPVSSSNGLTAGERLVVDTKPEDLAHMPEVPQHRFSMFTKGTHFAYARGLEIAPTHLPTALDALLLDGWELVSLFGATDSKHVGFVFKRVPKPTDIGEFTFEDIWQVVNENKRLNARVSDLLAANNELVETNRRLRREG